MMRGIEWIVDAHGCDPSALRDPGRLGALFDRIVEALALTPVAGPLWHSFPPPGGVTGVIVLAESHLACHTFPEYGSICVNVFCCRASAQLDAERIIADVLGATSVRVHRVERFYASVPLVGA